MDLPDYKEMYLTMVRASEDAMNILIEAQRKCEEMYISKEVPSADFLKVIEGETHKNLSGD